MEAGAGVHWRQGHAAGNRGRGVSERDWLFPLAVADGVRSVVVAGSGREVGRNGCGASGAQSRRVVVGDAVVSWASGLAALPPVLPVIPVDEVARSCSAAPGSLVLAITNTACNLDLARGQVVGC
ncbi:hypothetical protein SAMN05444320_103215 [Streptoalloteichus hindustanus]|uniref:Uncharacterized protein n=1 Tax=Streptoalloteichus hindustanus TaxID=2017 RepID=A0A1M5APX6_STRHI|nr:hypothetical protein SAMN05444320_103215 [Streptoalloteichus hindustanus]